jgi:large subunit ribosomal protein L23
MKELYQVIKRPVVTEKSNSLNEKLNQVVFEVDWDASKSEIKHAVEKIFNVKVEKVRTMRNAGKTKNYGRKSVHRRSSWKKAFVTLKEGNKIDFYEGIK